MNCPVCDSVRLREVEKEGVLIDICPNCKGVWLDRGELEKLMEGEREFRREYPQYDQDYERTKPLHNEPYKSYEDDYRKYPKHKKKKRVFDIFEDLFD